MSKSDNRTPDPAKAIILKPGQRTRGRRKPATPATTGPWQPHKGDCALDAWGVAIRALREQGHEIE